MSIHDIKDGVWPIPVAARSEAWVCGCSRAGIVGFNPAAGMDRCLSLVQQRSLRRDEHSSRDVLWI